MFLWVWALLMAGPSRRHCDWGRFCVIWGVLLVSLPPPRVIGASYIGQIQLVRVWDRVERATKRAWVRLFSGPASLQTQKIKKIFLRFPSTSLILDCKGIAWHWCLMEQMEVEVILTPEWEYGGVTLRDVREAGTSLTKQQWHRQNLHSQKQE